MEKVLSCFYLVIPKNTCKSGLLTLWSKSRWFSQDYFSLKSWHFKQRYTISRDSFVFLYTLQEGFLYLHMLCYNAVLNLKGPQSLHYYLHSLSGSQTDSVFCISNKSILRFCSFPPNHLDALSHGVVPASSVTWWTFFMPAPRAETSSIKLHSGTDTFWPGRFVWRSTQATLVANLIVLH